MEVTLSFWRFTTGRSEALSGRTADGISNLQSILEVLQERSRRSRIFAELQLQLRDEAFRKKNPRLRSNHI